MTDAEMKVNRLATIHNDLIAVTTAVRNAAADVRNDRRTIKAASEEQHTAEMNEKAARLDRMTLNTEDMGHELRGQIRECLLAYSYQRDNCKRSRQQFIQQGAFVSAYTEGGMFQELIALRKAAKAEQTPAVGAEVALIDGRIGTVQGVDENGVKVRMNCDTYSITTSAKNMVEMAVTEQPTPTQAKPCPTFGAECRGCPDCSAVMGDATYQEMEQALKEEVELIEGVGDITMETTQPEPEIDMGMDIPSTKLAPTPGNDEPAYLEPYEGVINTAKESVQGLRIRIESMEKALENGGERLKDFIIISRLGGVGYELIRGEWAATADLTNMAGFETQDMALEACPVWLFPQERGIAIADNLHHSKAALEQLTERLASQGIEA